MKTLIKRLREAADSGDSCRGHSELMHEAASVLVKIRVILKSDCSNGGSCVAGQIEQVIEEARK